MAKQSSASPLNHKSRTKWYGLSDLHLDTRNPRIGGRAGNPKTEVIVLDMIVEKFSVEDVLSSLAVNGFFDAEPLVGLNDNKGGGIRIVEGNRRLAACLILANDARAINQAARVRDSQALQKKHNKPPIIEVPILLFETGEWKELLPYLGVRHIAASQPWDSYAKAAWIALVLENGDLTLDDAIQMIGDQHRTTPRILEGF